MIKNYKLSSPFNYQNDKEYSINEPLEFWKEFAEKFVYWDKPFEKILNVDCNNQSEWFKGGLMNTCYNALDKHIINGRGKEIAMVCENVLFKQTNSITYQELYDKVTRFSRSLKNLGVTKDDMVYIHMNDSIQTVICMLSCARLGACHNLIYGGFVSNSFGESIDEMKPKVIITTNYGYIYDKIVYYSEILQDALSKSSFEPNHIVLYNRTDLYQDKQVVFENSLNFLDLIDQSIEPLLEYEPVESEHPLYIIYSSGTTNKPKAIVRNNGGNCVGLNYALRYNYGLKEGDNYFFKESIAWISGHTLSVYGCLLVGIKSVIVEGSLKDDIHDFWGLVEKHSINVFSSTPNFIRTLKKFDPLGIEASKYNLSTLKSVQVGSEKVHKSIIDYMTMITKKPTIVEFWQSESGWQITQNPGIQFPIREDSIGKPGVGFNVKIVSLGDNGKAIENQPNQIGNIVVKLPLPPGFTNRLYGDDENHSMYNKHYLNEFPGYFNTGDTGYYDSDGYFYYNTRSGDSIAVGPDSVSSVVLETEILKNQKVNDCCVVGINDELMGELPFGILVLQNHLQSDLNQAERKQLLLEINDIIHKNVLMDWELKDIIIVKKLPKTRTGKKIKSLIKSIINDEKYTIPNAMQDKNAVFELIDIYNNYKLEQLQ